MAQIRPRRAKPWQGNDAEPNLDPVCQITAILGLAFVTSSARVKNIRPLFVNVIFLLQLKKNYVNEIKHTFNRFAKAA